MITSFVSVDIETTGLNRNTDDIIEIGAVKIVNGVGVATFRALIQTPKELSDFTKSATGYTEEEVKQGLTPEDAVVLFNTFAKNLPIVAHNALFDLGFIANMFELEESNYVYRTEHEKFGYFCTMSMARLLHNRGVGNKLVDLCKQYGIQMDSHHHALNDAMATAELFIKLQEEALGLPPDAEVSDLQSLENTFEIKKQFHNVYAYMARYGEPEWKTEHTRLVPIGLPDIYIDKNGNEKIIKMG